MIKKIMVPILMMLSFSACKKDATNCDKTMAAIAGTYSVVKLEAGAGGVFIDVTNELEACSIDDRLVLNANGTSTYQDLGTACSPNGNGTGTWSITTAGKINIDGGGGSIDLTDADITSFDCTTLVMTGFESGIAGEQFKLTIRK